MQSILIQLREDDKIKISFIGLNILGFQLEASKENISALAETVDKAINTLTGIKKQWDTMAAKTEWNDIYKNTEMITKDLSPASKKIKDSYLLKRRFIMVKIEIEFFEE